jgi:hypothetical protein
MPEETNIKKLVALKGAKIEENQISGAAAVMGNLDRYGDVIYPGAFKKAIPGFLKSGFIADGHNWSDVSKIVAMPKSAKEAGSELQTVAEFHSDDYAQTVRQKCAERLANGLSVGLSIGFSTAKAEWFQDGAAMAKHIKDNGYDESLFDVPTIKKCKGMCRGIIEVGELFEYSIVTVPANPKATAFDVKDFSGESLADLSFDDHSESVLAAVRGLVHRGQGLKALRDTEGRQLSQKRLADFTELKELLVEILTAPVQVDAKALQLRAQVFLLEA